MNAPIRDAEQITGVFLLKAYAQEAATTTGSAVDTGTVFHQGMTFLVNLGVNAIPTADTIDLTIVGSNDNVTYETVATFAQWGIGTATGLITVGFDDTKGPKRYYKYVDTQSATADATFSVFAIGIRPSQL